MNRRGLSPTRSHSVARSRASSASPTSRTTRSTPRSRRPKARRSRWSSSRPRTSARRPTRRPARESTRHSCCRAPRQVARSMTRRRAWSMSRARSRSSRMQPGDPTVYVIEPHGYAVYADAALPWVPTAIVMDDDQEYPATDRQQLLAFDAGGHRRLGRDRQARVCVARPGRHRRGPDGARAVRPRAAPVPAPERRGHPRDRRPGRRHALRAEPDRHERFVRGAGDRGGVHDLRGALAAPGEQPAPLDRLRDRHADHRRPARVRARLEVGRRVRDRRARDPGARPLRARAPARDRRPPGHDDRPRLRRDLGRGGPDGRQLRLPRDHGRARRHRGPRERPPPRGVDVGRDAARRRRAHRRGAPRGPVRPRARHRHRRDRARPDRGDSDRDRAARVPLGGRAVHRLPARQGDSGSARSQRRRRRDDPAAILDPPADPPKGWLAARRGLRPAGALARALPARHPDRRLRGLLHPVGAGREPPARRRAGRRATRARRCSTSPTRCTATTTT